MHTSPHSINICTTTPAHHYWKLCSLPCFLFFIIMSELRVMHMDQIPGVLGQSWIPGNWKLLFLSFVSLLDTQRAPSGDRLVFFSFLFLVLYIPVSLLSFRFPHTISFLLPLTFLYSTHVLMFSYTCKVGRTCLFFLINSCSGSSGNRHSWPWRRRSGGKCWQGQFKKAVLQDVWTLGAISFTSLNIDILPGWKAPLAGIQRLRTGDGPLRLGKIACT
ncbi:hypothetical protein QBC35DRAFT_24475 [Podospora australis]|uniref:Uncharacterized protein n=1 Tax=Podospora australis TaxID=1536484 RepID=A0AAN6WZJ0_9PEZI|nr:hypothetical protein QBC35DRAFT_24475 [Podospora australis]